MEDQIDVRYDAYLSLLENEIRNAWVRNVFQVGPLGRYRANETFSSTPST
jgi:hypothetical protein